VLQELFPENEKSLARPGIQISGYTRDHEISKALVPPPARSGFRLLQIPERIYPIPVTDNITKTFTFLFNGWITSTPFHYCNRCRRHFRRRLKRSDPSTNVFIGRNILVVKMTGSLLDGN
jgi:hypothetical protein